MLVYLDSSVVCTDFYMKGTYFELLKRKATITMSEVVLDEVMNKYKEMLFERLQNTNKSISELNRYISSPIQLVNESVIDDELKKYSNFIEMFIIENGMTIAEPYPDIRHKDIVKRALQRKKPFTNDGKNGYRDYLVWQTFLSIAKSYVMETVCFITLNKKDFSDVKDEKMLHPDLLEEIDNMGITKDKVQYWNSLKDFVDNVIKPQLEQDDKEAKIVDSLLNDDVGFYNPLNSLLSSKLLGIDLDGYDIYVIGETLTLNSIEDIFSINIENVSEVSESEYLLEIIVDTVCSVHSYIFKSDLIVMGEDDLEDVQIIDSDWNEHYVLAETQIGLKIELEIIYEKNKKEFKTFDIANIGDYNCLYCQYD